MAAGKLKGRTRAAFAFLIGGVIGLPLLPSVADAVHLGAGLYGVYGIPVVQEDVGPGPLYGGRIRARFGGPLAAEAYYGSFQEGDVEFTVRDQTQTIVGGSQDFFGLNACFGGPGGSGMGLYLTGGLASYQLARPHRKAVRELGGNAGIGLELRSEAGLGIDLSGRLHVVPMEEGGSRKFAGLLAGINYYFLR